MFVIILFVVAILISVIVAVFRYRKKVFGEYTPTNPLRKEGLIISLKPDDIVIKSREYWVDKEVELTRINMLDALYDNNKSDVKEKKNVSVLIYEGERNGKPVKYTSPPLYTDEGSIRFALSRMKSVDVYVDRKNENNYYFDIAPFAGL